MVKKENSALISYKIFIYNEYFKNINHNYVIKLQIIIMILNYMVLKNEF